MGRYFLKFSYLGTRYRGLQKNVVRFNEPIRDPDTVQGAIEDALATLLPKCTEWPKITLSSRTDVGVHALCSTAHVDLHNKHNCLYNPNLALRYVNRYFFRCKHDVRLLEFIPVTEDFHARYFAKSRTYVYRFMRAKDQNEHRIPISETSHAFHLRSETFDIERLKRATQLFMGTKDFRTFSTEAITTKPVQYVRQLQAITVEKGQPLMPFDPLCQNFDFWNITFKARSFLYKQVRRMVAALINVGTGKLTERDINIMLQVPNHRNWDPRIQIVPAHGLYLANIEYSQEELDNCIIEFKESADPNYPNTIVPIYANEAQ